jgi:hypothetical protein
MPSTRANVTATVGGNSFFAGKNRIINGDFFINQRAFSSTTSNSTYGFDRFYSLATDGTTTYSAQTFTVGAAPVSGYEARNYARVVTTGQTLASALSGICQNIEDVRTFAGQTVTISFWAQAGSGTPKIAVEAKQNFGTGGSPSSDVNTYAGQVTLSTSWARYSLTVAVPSISGKTIGTDANSSYLRLGLIVSAGSNFDSRTGTLGIQSNTFNIWGVQVEAGSVATPFQTATGTLTGELAACYRYYFRYAHGVAFGAVGMGVGATSTTAYFALPLPVEMRVTPNAVDYSSLNIADQSNAGIAVTSVTLEGSQNNKQVPNIIANTASGITQYRPYMIRNNNSTSGYLGFTAEL